MTVPFFDLKRQYQNIKADLHTAFTDVMEKGTFIAGAAVEKFEHKMRLMTNTSHAIAVANGTDSMEILLKAFGIGTGDEVIVPTHTWVSTAEAVLSCGATPVFADTDEFTYTLNVDKVAARITKKTKAIIPVHLAGRCTEMGPIMTLANDHNLWVIEDAAQAIGAEYNGKPAGSIGHAGSFSFYPTKNLGAYGDAGMIVTNIDDVATFCRQYANHGQSEKSVHQFAGRNSRLDTLQAAFLSAKLKCLPAWNEQRIEHAELYRQLLDTKIPLAPPSDHIKHVYHLFIIQVDNRDDIMVKLKTKGIETAIHYPAIVPDTLAFRTFRKSPTDYPVSTSYTKRLLSLPIYPELTSEEITYVAETLNSLL